eukprot:gene3287-3605_t
MASSFNVLTAEWCHETNTFSTISTTLDSFYAQYYYETSQEIEKERKGTKTVLGATFEAAELYQWRLYNTICASANPAGAVTSEAFEIMCKQILQPVFDGVVFDGILLHLHGAMVAVEYEDAEGELLRRIRDEVGADMPIIVTLDLHANVTAKMASLASALLAVRTYPHIDFYETAQRAAALLQSAMKGEVSLLTVLAKRPMLRGLDGGKTHAASNMTELIHRGEAFENDTSIAVLVVSVCAGFSAADIFEIGPSVTVTVDRLQSSKAVHSLKEAQEVAEILMDYAWESRYYSSERHYTIPQAIAAAETFTNSSSSSTLPETRTAGHLLVIADVSDNPGSGHYGDTTALLQALIEKDIPGSVFYAIYDAAAAEAAASIGVGQSGVLTLGGKGNPSMGGPPLTLTAHVVALTDGYFRTYGPMGFGGMLQNFGLSALIRVGQVEIIIISHNGQLLDTAQITSMGVDLHHKQVVLVKSKHHFRASLAPLAKEIITVDGGGMGSALLFGGEIPEGMYKKVRRPIWPLDKELD